MNKSPHTKPFLLVLLSMKSHQNRPNFIWEKTDKVETYGLKAHSSQKATSTSDEFLFYWNNTFLVLYKRK